jgi:hypothetical protein
MASDKRISWWLTLAVLIMVAVAVPLATDKSWPVIFNAAFDSYMAAAEKATAEDEDDDDDDEATEQAASMLVTLDDDVVNAAGIQTLSLQQDIFFPETRAYARIIDVRELIQWRSKLKQLSLALELARSDERAQFEEFQRLKKLAASTGSIANKKVVYAKSNWRQAQLKQESAQLALDNARTEVSQGWGPVIADWLSDEDSKAYQRLVSRQETLIQITLPVSLSLPTDVNVIQVSRQGNRDTARKAYFVSPAYVSSHAAQGETYYFRMDTGRLRLGMRLHAWIPQNEEGLNGFFIPERAIVWVDGKPWTYIQQADDSYRRKALEQGQAITGGIFIQSQFEAGDKLVVAGSQMLLSEEFRWQIMDEDDD